MWSTKIPPAGLSCYPASLCYLLDGSRTLEPLSVRKGRSLRIRLCIMFSIFVDFDGYKRGPTSRHDVGMRYKEIVTLRRMYIILAIVWVVCLVASLFFHLNYRIAVWCSLIATPSFLMISIASYTKIFRALGHHQAQIQDHVQQQPSHPNALNMVRYREAVYNALWVQLALVVCYAPQFVGKIVRFAIRKRFSSFFIIHEMAIILMFFNSTLNPFLYCWKISEVRRAVKLKIRQAICYAKGWPFNVGMCCFLSNLLGSFDIFKIIRLSKAHHNQGHGECFSFL